jgi:hypothetical protein
MMALNRLQQRSITMIRHCLLALAFSLSLAGCMTNNVIRSVDLAPGQTLAVNTKADFVVTGYGTCDIVIDWGDGSKDVIDDAKLAEANLYPHTYKGWRGGKTVTVTPVSPNDCIGNARQRFVTSPSFDELGWARDPRNLKQDARSCVTFPNRPFLTPNSIVKITAQPMPQINFGCGYNGCIYDPDGKPGTVSAAPFEFPIFREYSLVLREGGAGGRLFQGGKSAALFTSVTGGQLEFCMNNDRPQNNITGGWQIGVRVDELGPDLGP